MGIRDWAQGRMTKGARAAYDRGDPVYMHTLQNVRAPVVSQWVKAIESVGWRLEQQPQQSVAGWPAKGQVRWTMTFRRVDT